MVVGTPDQAVAVGVSRPLIEWPESMGMVMFFGSTCKIAHIIESVSNHRVNQQRGAAKQGER